MSCPSNIPNTIGKGITHKMHGVLAVWIYKVVWANEQNSILIVILIYLEIFHILIYLDVCWYIYIDISWYICYRHMLIHSKYWRTTNLLLPSPDWGAAPRVLPASFCQNFPSLESNGSRESECYPKTGAYLRPYIKGNLVGFIVTPAFFNPCCCWLLVVGSFDRGGVARISMTRILLPAS